MENDIKYNAFISYNHNSRDIEVAKELQKRLEHFKIPKGVKTAGEITKIDRVFLDVGELGVAADLNDTIKNALDNTDNLIVICSPESKASQWVHKEIEHFLTKHSPDQILTVITEGEPKDVLPEEIIHQEIVNEDGSVTIVDKEPLSCDFREGMQKAGKQELPRLVAGIIGCRYDDLVQRQRQHKMRQMMVSFAIVTALMVVATSYFIWSNRAIRKNLNNTLMEQSRTLAMQSEKALNNGDRIGAIRYALDALPKEGDDRPVVPEAVEALSVATEIYRQPSSQVFNASRELFSGRITGTDVIKDGEKQIYAAMTSNGDLYVADADTGEQLAEGFLSTVKKNLDETNDYIRGFKLLPNGRIALILGDSVSVVDYNKEDIVWTIDQEEYYSYSSNFFVNKEHIVITASKSIKNNESGKSDYVKFARCIDLKTGDAKFDVAIPRHSRESEDILNSSIITKTIVSPDGNTAVLSGYYYIEKKYIPYLFRFDLTSGEIKSIPHDGIEQIVDIAFRPDGSLIVCGYTNFVGSGPSDGEFEGQNFHTDWKSKPLTTVRKKKVVIKALDRDEELWSVAYDEEFSGIPAIATYEDVSYDKPIIVTGSKLREFSKDGKELVKTDAQSKITKAWRTKDKDGESVLYMVLYDGSFARLYDGWDYLAKHSNYFPVAAEACDVIEGSIYLKCASDEGYYYYRILKYDDSVDGDRKWQAYNLREKMINYGNMATAYKDSFIEYYKIDDIEYLQRTDVKSGEVLWTTEIAKGNRDNIFLGLDDERNRIVILESIDSDYSTKSYMVKLRIVDLETGNISDIEIATDREVYYSADINGMTKDGKPFMIEKDYSKGDENEALLTFIDVDNKDIDSVELEGALDVSYEMQCVYDSDTGRIAVWNENEIVVFGIDGRRICEIKELPYALKCACIGYDNNLYVIGEEARTSADSAAAKMYCYDMNSGTEAKNRLPFDDSVLPENAGYYDSNMSIADMSDEEYLLILIGQGGLLDKESGMLRVYIPELDAYNSEVGEFYIDRGHAPYRSVQEMIEEANEMIS